MENGEERLNAFAQSLKDQRRASHKRSSAVRETTPEYTSDSPQSPLFSETELEWLETVPNLYSPISNLRSEEAYK